MATSAAELERGEVGYGGPETGAPDDRVDVGACAADAHPRVAGERVVTLHRLLRDHEAVDADRDCSPDHRQSPRGPQGREGARSVCTAPAGWVDDLAAGVLDVPGISKNH